MFALPGPPNSVRLYPLAYRSGPTELTAQRFCGFWMPSTIGLLAITRTSAFSLWAPSSAFTCCVRTASIWRLTVSLMPYFAWKSFAVSARKIGFCDVYSVTDPSFFAAATHSG